MKLLLDARFWRQEAGGISRYSRQLLDGLLKLETSDHFHVLIRDLDEAQFRLNDRRVTKHVTSIGHYTLAEQTQLPGFIQTLGVDLVHFLNFNQPVLGIGVPRVTTIHDLTVKYYPVGRSQTDPLRRLAFELVMRRAAHSDRVIAISRATKIDVVRDLGSDPACIDIIAEAADERFKPQPSSAINLFKRRTGLHKPYILFVNQWRPHKGLPELIAAFDSIKAVDHLPHQLVITGVPNAHFPKLAAAIETSAYRSDIVLPGFVDDADLPLYYAGAAVTAFPSYYEGFGLGVVESMQAGTPVVCTRTSSLPEVAGEAGYFVMPNDAADLARGLRAVLTDSKLHDRLSQAGIVQAKRFSWEKMAQETYAVYQRVLSISH